MTVAELIAALQESDPAAEVVVAVQDLDADVASAEAVLRRVERSPSTVWLRSLW